MNAPVNTLRKLPIGIQSFEFLRSEGYLYVDKTELVYRLVTKGSLISSVVPGVSGRACYFPRLKLISRGRKNFSKDSLSRNWNRIGSNTRCCT